MRASKNRLGSFSTVHVVSSTTLALLAIGLFGLLALHTAKLTRVIRENVTMQVYLHNTVSENQRMHMRQLLSKQDFVLKKHGHPQLVFKNKEEVARLLIQKTTEDFLQVLNENPLRDVYVITIHPAHQNPERLQAIRLALEAIPGVFEVDYMENLAASISKNLIRMGLVLGLVTAILLLVVAVLIHNTLKLAIYSQRFLIKSMTLVGATAAFIRRPFLLRAILMGLLAGIWADLLLMLLLHGANAHIEGLTQLQEPDKVFILLAMVPLLGGCICYLGTYGAISKYLQVSLDDLY